jgi:hypothetical protein
MNIMEIKKKESFKQYKDHISCDDSIYYGGNHNHEPISNLEVGKTIISMDGFWFSVYQDVIINPFDFVSSSNRTERSINNDANSSK